MKAFNIKNLAKVYVYSKPMSMAKGFPGLQTIVESELKHKITNGDLFLFVNKLKNYIKILYWDHDGICMFCKRLPCGVFDITLPGHGAPMHLSMKDMEALVNHVIIGNSKKIPLRRAA